MASNKKPQTKGLSTTNLLLLVVLACIVVVVIGIFLSKRFVGELLLNQKVIQKESMAATQLETNLQLAPTLVKSYQGQSALVRREITDALPTAVDMPGLLAMLENIAGSSSVTIRSFAPLANPGTSTAATRATPVGSSLTVEGSYVNILTFLANSQLSVRPLQLSSLQMQGSASDVTATLDLTTYYEAAPSLLPQTEVIK